MNHRPFDSNAKSHDNNKQEEVRGILHSLLRMATRVMAKRLFEKARTRQNTLPPTKGSPKTP